MVISTGARQAVARYGLLLIISIARLVSSIESDPFFDLTKQWNSPLAEAIEKTKGDFIERTLPTTCKQVNSSWLALVSAIDQAGESLSLCPFQILKPPDATIVLNKQLHISCVRARLTDRCILKGEGNHIRIAGSDAEVLIEGLRFEKATASAFRIAPSASKTQILRDCEFTVNVASADGWRGAAIKTEAGTSLIVSSCVFDRNGAVQGAGGAIYSRGYLDVIGSTFIQNKAKFGGAINSETSFRVAYSNFTRNEATRDAGGAIRVKGLANWMSGGTNRGYSNFPCSGVYDSLTKTCHEFDSMISQSYDLGNLTVRQEGLLVSSGLVIKVLARSNQRVEFTSPEAHQSYSSTNFHAEPDGAATFALNDGGWVYVSNSESPFGKGGVYALEFDARGLIRNYSSRLKGTTRNCNGGATPWETWVSCEEFTRGQCWQVDPTGQREPMTTKLVEPQGGSFEGMAHDLRNPEQPRFFVTEDHEYGALRRFSPTSTNETWSMLHGDGVLDYLELFPNNNTFRWTPSLEHGRKSAFGNYQFSEGIITTEDGILLFVTKKTKQLFRLDLDSQTYTVRSTRIGALQGGGNFAAGPDQLVSFSNLLYFTEDGGATPGLYVYDGTRFYTLIGPSMIVSKTTKRLVLHSVPTARNSTFVFRKQGTYSSWREKTVNRSKATRAGAYSA